MSDDWSSFLSRDELLGGLPARRASTLLYAIENRTAHLVAQSRRAMATYLPEQTAEEHERRFLEALAQGRTESRALTVQDLERYATHWADLVPPDSGIRAALARMLSEKYPLAKRYVPAIRNVLGLDSDAVRQSYLQLHQAPLDDIYQTTVSGRERLRWFRSRTAQRLETLPPFWTAFALTLTETVGAGILALPIALAELGPIPGLLVILTLGIVNILTIAAIAEAVARNGGMRYGHSYYGRLVRDYLGRPGLLILIPALALFSVVVLLAYYIGLSSTLADATGLPAEVWAGCTFLIGLAMLRRESIDATVASALVVGAASLGLILLLSLLTLPHVTSANLRHSTVPWLNGEPFDASLLELIFGVVLLAYFGHTSAGNCASVVLRRDPSAKSFISGSVCAIAAAMVIYAVWVVIVNGAVSAETLSRQSGTALVPLADEVGPGIHVVGSIFAVLAMGMASIHVSLGLFNQVREWLPKTGGPSPTEAQPATLFGSATGKFVIGVLPVALIFFAVEGLFIAGRESFAGPLGFLGVITSSVLGGIFPMIMLAASRQKGDYAIKGVWRFLGQPIVGGLICGIFVAGLFLHALVIWDELFQQAIALLVGIATIGVFIVSLRRGAFSPRVVIEVRVEPNTKTPATVTVVAAGQEITADIRWPQADAWATNNGFRSVDISLPAMSAKELRIWTHEIDADARSIPLPTQLEMTDGNQISQLDLRNTSGQLVIPNTHIPRQIRIARA